MVIEGGTWDQFLLILEDEAVLTRPELSRLTDAEVIEIIDAIATVSIHARLSFRWRALCFRMQTTTWC
jgi:hypothetical protein